LILNDLSCNNSVINLADVSTLGTDGVETSVRDGGIVRCLANSLAARF
jgi:hypothetical protein